MTIHGTAFRDVIILTIICMTFYMSHLCSFRLARLFVHITLSVTGYVTFFRLKCIKIIFRAFGTVAKCACSLYHVRPSVRMYQLGSLWAELPSEFMKICREYSDLVKIKQKCLARCWKTHVRFIVTFMAGLRGAKASLE